MSLLADHNMPFAAALLLMVLVALVQAIGLGGMDIDADVDVDVDGDFDLDSDVDAAGGMLDGLMSIIGLNRVPLMIWLAAFLFLFAALGVGIQGLAENLTGGPLYRWLAALFAGGAALPVTGLVVRPLARILPGDETTAVGLDTLVGRRGTIITGRATTGSPARTRVYDRYRRPHFVMVEPHEASSEMHEGDEVLLVRREDNIFYGLPLQERKLAPVD